MNERKIESVLESANEIKSFKDCYEGYELWGVVDGPVPAERLISFLIDHPEFQQIADKINASTYQ
jgi:hypothetical protein